MKMPGFAGGTYQTKSAVMAGEDCVNLFPEPVPKGNKAQAALLSAPGVREFATMPEVGGRGIFSHNERLFTVFGRSLCEVAESGAVTVIGTVAVDGNPVIFDTNGEGGDELLASSGGAAHLVNLTTLALSTPLASGSTQIGQLDSFFVSLDAATSTLRASDSLDGSVWNGLLVAQRTSASDPWIAMIVARGEIHLFGNKTGEVWYNAGLPLLPFAQRPEGFFQTGIAAPFSLSRFNGTIAWLGASEHGNPGVYTLDGYAPTKISTPGIDYLIQSYETHARIANAVGWSYEREGHIFYVLSFPTAQRTLVYDATTNEWHRRGYWDQATAQFTMYRPTFHAKCFSKNLVCGLADNKIYELTDEVFTDVGGAPLRRVRRMGHLSMENQKIFFPSVELECDRGQGNADVANPTVNLRYSNDGGKTWGASRPASTGEKGDYGTRVRWNMCGSGRDRVWELWTSDPAEQRWIDFYVDARLGRGRRAA